MRLERVCGSKYTLEILEGAPGGHVNLGIVTSKRPCSFRAPNIGHVDSNGVDGRGKNLFCSLKRNQKKPTHSSQISQAT